jgi:hypothetical protein
VISTDGWKLHPKPIFTTPNDVLEDFSVMEISPGQYMAFFTTGDSLQNQRLFYALSKSPYGPFEVPTRMPDVPTHTRLYRSELIEGPRKGDSIITAVWPGLPKVGLWCFSGKGLPKGLLRKSLICGPVPGSDYCSVAVANPSTIWDGEHYNIFFEGRAEKGPTGEVFWWLMQATWRGDEPQATVVEKPLRDGANPFIAKFGGDYFLYFSKWTGRGFETWLLTKGV